MNVNAILFFFIIVSVLGVGCTGILDSKGDIDTYKEIPAAIQPEPPKPPISVLQSGKKEIDFKYVLRGRGGIISATLYRGTMDVLTRKGIPVACYRYTTDSKDCTSEELRMYYIALINETYQQGVLNEIATNIRNTTDNREDQVRIAISLVQNIPYGDIGNTVYPYETLYYNRGKCQDKSLLTAALISKLGFGSAVFLFDQENHMAAGVKVASKLYGLHSRDFAFVETTTPSIITDSDGVYYGEIRLTSNPSEYVISDGIAMTTLFEERRDAKSFNDIVKRGSTVSAFYYDEWYSLVTKYGMDIDAPYAQYGTKGSENIYNYYASLNDEGSSNCVIYQNGVCVS